MCVCVCVCVCVCARDWCVSNRARGGRRGGGGGGVAMRYIRTCACVKPYPTSTEVITCIRVWWRLWFAAFLLSSFTCEWPLCDV